MRRNSSLAILAAILVLFVFLVPFLSSLPASAAKQAPASASLTSDVAGNYPGRVKGTEGYMQYAESWIAYGAGMYFRLYHKWPAKWRDVVDAGLFQVDLIALDGHVIDPDGAKHPELGDTLYFPPNQYSNEAYTATAGLENHKAWQYRKIPQPQTLESLFAAFTQEGQITAQHNAQAYYKELQQDPKRLKLFALAKMIDHGITLYGVIKGDYPASWNDLLNSRIGPIDNRSVNPVTGGPILGDGSPNNFLYKFYPKSAKQDFTAYYLNYIDPNGQAPEFGFTY